MIHDMAIIILQNDVRFHADLARKARENWFEETYLRHVRYMEKLEASIKVLETANT